MNDEIQHMLNEMDEKKLTYLNSSIIKDAKNNILQKMGFERNELKHYHKVLKNYRFVDELDELSLGHHIRWFNLTKLNNMKLYNGAILTNIEYINNQVYLLCKSYKNKIFTIKMDKIILFQKFYDQELLMIRILDYIQDK
jgi:hypothetical protein|tara:strand:+ start:138 stop:557 length:420 start_codon:yes stop_codon:yes gene_type:complete